MFGSCNVNNNTPAITDLKAEPSQVDRNMPSTLKCTAVDPDGDILTYRWEAKEGTIVGNGPMVKWIAPSYDGVYRIVVSVIDGKGGKVSREVIVKVVCD